MQWCKTTYCGSGVCGSEVLEGLGGALLTWLRAGAGWAAVIWKHSWAGHPRRLTPAAVGELSLSVPGVSAVMVAPCVLDCLL